MKTHLLPSISLGLSLSFPAKPALLLLSIEERHTRDQLFALEDWRLHGKVLIFQIGGCLLFHLLLTASDTRGYKALTVAAASWVMGSLANMAAVLRLELLNEG